MIRGWRSVLSLLSPSFWLSWVYGDNGVVDHAPSLPPTAEDTCVKCSRFLALHSRENNFCSYHNVHWNSSSDMRSPFMLFRNTYEMWLRSRCGADMDEHLISFDLSTLAVYLEFAVQHSVANGNMYDFADDVLADFKLVCSFLDDQRSQKCYDTHKIIKTAESLHHFIEFRKFQLPIKGIIENRYSATEQLITAYQQLLRLGHVSCVLRSSAPTLSDLTSTVDHFTPQYNLIVDIFTRCDRVKSLESGADLQFATSFITVLLFSIFPRHLSVLHLVRVRDLLPKLNDALYDLCDDDGNMNTTLHFHTEVDRFVIGNVDSPSQVSACITSLQSIMALNTPASFMLRSYIEYIHTRITRSNDYLLLNHDSLGLTASDIKERISTLVYRATGKLINVTSKLQPVAEREDNCREKIKAARHITFSNKVSRRIVNRYNRKQKKARKRLHINFKSQSF